MWLQGDEAAAAWSEFCSEASVSIHLGTKLNGSSVILLCCLLHCSVLFSYLHSQQEKAGGFGALSDSSFGSC